MAPLATHFKKIAADQKYLVLILVVFCFIFELVFAWLFFESGIQKKLARFILELPVSFTAFLGIQGGISGFFVQMLAFGYTHPVILISLAFLAISLPARYLSAEIESRTFDLVLTKPVARYTIPLSTFGFMAMVLFFQFSAMVLGTLAGRWWFGLNVAMIGYVRVALAGWCFFLSMGSISLCMAAFQSAKARAAGKTVGLMVLLYFFDTIVRLSTRLAHLKDLSYFQLYQPGLLMADPDRTLVCSCLSLMITALFLAAGIYWFCRRDL